MADSEIDQSTAVNGSHPTTIASTWFRWGAVAGAILLTLASVLHAQTPPLTPDIPAKFEAPTAILRLRQARRDDPDARRREAPHRHRHSQGRQARADHPDPHALQRLQAGRADPVAAHAGDAAAGRRGVRGRRLHPRLPGRARQVRLRRRLRHDPAAEGAAQRERGRSFHRRLRHHRLAGEERARIATARSGCSAARTKASPS